MDSSIAFQSGEDVFHEFSQEEKATGAAKSLQTRQLNDETRTLNKKYRVSVQVERLKVNPLY